MLERIAPGRPANIWLCAGSTMLFAINGRTIVECSELRILGPLLVMLLKVLDSYLIDMIC